MNENHVNENNEKHEGAVVDYFVHEGIMTRMDMAMDKLNESNRRMHSALRTVCVTLVLVVIIFVIGYTINNNNWLNYVNNLKEQTVENSDAMETPNVQQP